MQGYRLALYLRSQRNFSECLSYLVIKVYVQYTRELVQQLTTPLCNYVLVQHILDLCHTEWLHPPWWHLTVMTKLWFRDNGRCGSNWVTNSPAEVREKSKCRVTDFDIAAAACLATQVLQWWHLPMLGHWSFSWGRLMLQCIVLLQIVTSWHKPDASSRFGK